MQKVIQPRTSTPAKNSPAAKVVGHHGRTARVARPFRHTPNGSTARKRTLLWIDDYKPGLMTYKAIFENLGFHVLTASRGSSGLQLAATNPVDAVIVDYEMPGMDGGTVATALKTRHPGIPVIMFSGSRFVPSRVKHLVDAFCDKAGSYTELLATLNQVLARKPSQDLPSRPIRMASEQGRRAVA